MKHGDSEPLSSIAEKLGVGHLRRHVLLCVGPDCCPPKVGEAAWDCLKKELKNHDLTLSRGPNECYRTKAHCLRVCTRGPILLVYPEGTWYSGMTADRIPRFVAEHLIAGRPVQEWIFATQPLPLPVLPPQRAE